MMAAPEQEEWEQRSLSGKAYGVDGDRVGPVRQADACFTRETPGAHGQDDEEDDRGSPDQDEVQAVAHVADVEQSTTGIAVNEAGAQPGAGFIAEAGDDAACASEKNEGEAQDYAESRGRKVIAPRALAMGTASIRKNRPIWKA
jgi:hypothetical protein